MKRLNQLRPCPTGLAATASVRSLNAGCRTANWFSGSVIVCRVDRGFLGWLLLGAWLSLTPVAEAQVVNDGETNTLSGGIHFFAGDVTVGFSNSFTRLNIVNGAALTNSGEGYIGRLYTYFDDTPPFDLTTSRSNFVVIDGVGSRWDLDDGNPVNGNNVLNVGYEGSYNTLLITNGGMVDDGAAYIGYASSHNLAIVSGNNSLWKHFGGLSVGGPGHGSDVLLGPRYSTSNMLLVTNGGVVLSGEGLVGNGHTAEAFTHSRAIVTGPGSTWSNDSWVIVGNVGRSNTLEILNGGKVSNGHHGWIGYGGDYNHVTVAGSNSVWLNSIYLLVGEGGNSNSLTIADGGMVQAQSGKVGWRSNFGDVPSWGNEITVSNGTLITTYVSDGLQPTLEIQGGNLRLDAGEVITDHLWMQGELATFDFNAGTLAVSYATISNGAAFVVGDGSGSASYRMSGVDTNVHRFYDGLLITTNSILNGNGTIVGVMTNQGVIAPGASVGIIVFSNSPVMQGAVSMDISRSGGVLTNDQIHLAGSITYGGSLVVSNLGPDTLVTGNSFQLFSAAAYAGNFVSITLPTLPPQCSWTNKLHLNGSIEVLGPPVFTGATVSGTNLLLSVFGGAPNGSWHLLSSTNVVLPVSVWTTNSTGLFDAFGNLSLTNPINFAEPQRFFRLQVP